MFFINVFKQKNEHIVFLRQDWKPSDLKSHFILNLQMCLLVNLIFVSLTMKQIPRQLPDLAL